MPASPSRPPSPAGRVLVIDDEELVRAVAEAALRRAGYAVETAADGPAGLAAYRREPADVVLLDLSLPGPPGGSVLGGLLALDPAARVLVTTGWRPDELPEGAAGLLTKPFTPDRLLAAVRAAAAN